MVSRDQHTAGRSCTAKASARAPDSPWRAKICYAQWEDVGPFNTDSAGYVLGDQRPSPNVNHGAGIREGNTGVLFQVRILQKKTSR